MKHTIISFICVIIVVGYSLFTMYYVNSFSRQTEAYISSYPTKEITTNTVNELNKIYDEKKQVLRFILNRDHTDKFEEALISLESAVMFDNKQDILSNVMMLKSTVEDIRKMNGFTI